MQWQNTYPTPLIGLVPRFGRTHDCQDAYAMSGRKLRKIVTFPPSDAKSWAELRIGVAQLVCHVTVSLTRLKGE